MTYDEPPEERDQSDSGLFTDVDDAIAARLTRTDLLKYGAALGLSAAAARSSPAFARSFASEAESITAITWGDPYIDITRKIADEWSKRTGIRVKWELHQGGASTVLAKISASWPKYMTTIRSLR